MHLIKSEKSNFLYNKNFNNLYYYSNNRKKCKLICGWPENIFDENNNIKSDKSIISESNESFYNNNNIKNNSSIDIDDYYSENNNNLSSSSYSELLLLINECENNNNNERAAFLAFFNNNISLAIKILKKFHLNATQMKKEIQSNNINFGNKLNSTSRDSQNNNKMNENIEKIKM